MPAVVRLCVAFALLCPALPLFGQTPTVTDDRLVIELVAQEPDIVTPTGLAVDEQGRIWVIENHTHHRGPAYKGPASDRIRVFSDLDGNGKARQITTFAEGFKDSMSIALGKNGVYLATRSEILLLENKDGKVGARRSLIKLNSTATYPHNGLCGFAFDALGDMYFGMGENLGVAYELVGADGTTMRGAGEGGNLFSCRPDGTGLTRVATGFWNPFHHCVDAFGRVFVVDNDPDARGPCRLLHVVPGGDYGYRFRYGRNGTHPFQAWNGELPGTLGMVSGTGEAPSGVTAYESTGLPDEYRGSLLSTSWGDHVVERFQLMPKGASFAARATTLVRGGEHFRPVGIVTGPDGALYLSDWVDKSYPVHGKGRLWRIRMKKPPADDGLRPSQVAALGLDRLGQLLGHPKQEIRTAATRALVGKGAASNPTLEAILNGKGALRAKLQALWAAGALESEARYLVNATVDADEPELRATAVQLLSRDSKISEARRLDRALNDRSPHVRMQAILHLHHPDALGQIVPILADADPFLASAALHALGRPDHSGLLLPHVQAADPRLGLGILLALRRTGDADGRTALNRFLKDADPAVRRAAIQWVGEEVLKEFAAQLPVAATREPVTPQLFQALMASQHLLSGGQPSAEPINDKLLAKMIRDPVQSPLFRTLSLQLMRPDHPALTVEVMSQLLTAKDAGLRRQASRTLALRADQSAQELLLKLAVEPDRELPMRADAIMGLAQSAPNSTKTQHILGEMLVKPELRRDALRSLRGAVRQKEFETVLLEWWDGAKLPAAERPELAAQMLLALKASETPAVKNRLKDLAKLADPSPASEAEWRKWLEQPGDPVAGERVFFHSYGPRCGGCHRVDGRGERIGPDLSSIARALNRDRLIESILTPSKEIAPQFVAWRIETRDGRQRIGVIVDEGFNSTVTIGDAQGKLEVIKRTEIEEKTALTTSLMPDRLHALMTPREFRDLLAYLLERK
jgi:putative membrane-bound dehydrogenase-like protein